LPEKISHLSSTSEEFQADPLPLHPLLPLLSRPRRRKRRKRKRRRLLPHPPRKNKKIWIWEDSSIDLYPIDPT
jgi:hypothetical protein